MKAKKGYPILISDGLEQAKRKERRAAESI